MPLSKIHICTKYHYPNKISPRQPATQNLYNSQEIKKCVLFAVIFDLFVSQSVNRI
jgi:hypothetical protein